MSRRRTHRIAALSVAGLLSVVLAGCGSEDPADGAAAGVGDGGQASEATGLPAVSVLDLTAGDAVVLSDYLPADRPVLVWMWSPY
jgi:hypothetical protein